MSKKLILNFLALSALCFNLNAEDISTNNWHTTVGVGVGVFPTYEGSNKYVATPIPYFSINYKNKISFGMEGLRASLLKDNNYEIGIGLTYHSGRDEDGNTLFGSNNDNSLHGLNEIDAAVGAKAYGIYNFEPLSIKGGMTKYMGDDNDGLVLDMSLFKNIAINKNINLILSIGTKWADSSYMDTFFGVSANESINSNFSRFDAASGFKEINTGINVNYLIDKSWFLNAGIHGTQLVGDAAKSPISASDTGVSFLMIIGYKL